MKWARLEQDAAHIEPTPSACYATYMAKYLARTCPMCKNYLGVVIAEATSDTKTHAVDGLCARCGYKVSWMLIHCRPARTQN